MVLKLYGYNLSPPSELVATVLHEKQIPFKFVNVDLPKGEQRSKEYLAMQPFGQVPLIVSAQCAPHTYIRDIDLGSD